MGESLDDYLRRIPVGGRDVAVVGPNLYVSDDPSVAYFANRMARQPGTLTILDDKPQWTMWSHGNVYTHLDDLSTLIAKGVRMKWPEVEIGDVTKTGIQGRFDLIYDFLTFKCIVNSKANEKESGYLKPAKAVLDAYLRMLKPKGIAVFAYPNDKICGFEHAGYATLLDLLSGDERVEYGRCDNLRQWYQLRDIDRERVREMGRLTSVDGKESTRIALDSQGRVTLGHGCETTAIRVTKKC